MADFNQILASLQQMSPGAIGDPNAAVAQHLLDQQSAPGAGYAASQTALNGTPASPDKPMGSDYVASQQALNGNVPPAVISPAAQPPASQADTSGAAPLPPAAAGQQAPVVPPTPRLGLSDGGATSGASDLALLNKSAQEEKAGAQGMAAAQTAEANELAPQAKADAAAQAKMVQDAQAQQAAAQAHAADLMAKAESAATDYKNAKLDPNEYWSSRDTGQKIGIGVGMLLSGIGSGITGQENAGMKVFREAVNNNIMAQKDAIERSKTASNTFGDLSKQFQQMGMNSIEATHATTLAMQDAAKTHAMAAAYAQGGPKAQAQLQSELGNYDKDLSTRHQNLSNSISGRVLQNAQAKNSIEEANSKRLESANQQANQAALNQAQSQGGAPSGPLRQAMRKVRGLDTLLNVQGAAPNQWLPTENADAINKAEPGFNSLKSDLMRAQELRAKNAGVKPGKLDAQGVPQGSAAYFGNESTELNTLKNRIAAEIADLGGKGAISNRNVDIYNSMVGDINKSNLLPGNPNAGIQQMLQGIERDRLEHHKANGAKIITQDTVR